MGLLFLDSFDDRYFTTGSSYASYHAKWDVVFEDSSGGYANSLEQVAGRTGYACKFGGTSYLEKTNLAVILDALTWGLALKVTSAPASETDIVTITISSGAGTSYVRYKLTPSLTLRIYDTGNNLIATSVSSISLNTFYYIESSLDITGSTCTLYKDETNWLSVPNAVPTALIEASIDSIKLSGGVIIDDFYVANNSSVRLGAIKIDATVPNAATSLSRSNPWTALYTNVNECFQANHDANTTYDESNSSSPSSVSYNFPNKSSGTIKGLQTVAWVAARLVSGSPGNLTLNPIVNVSSTDYVASVGKLALSITPTSPPPYSLIRGIWDKNPATSLAWSNSEYNSAELGVKCENVSANALGRLTAITVELAYTGGTVQNSRIFIIS